jgi:hypothetical protein
MASAISSTAASPAIALSAGSVRTAAADRAADRVFWPHLILGLLEVGMGLTTSTTPAAVAVTAEGAASATNRRPW